MAGSLILGVAYGIDVQPKNDPYIATAETALHAMSMAGNAGAYLVDYMPFREFDCFFRRLGTRTDAYIHSQTHSFLVPGRYLQASSGGMAEGNQCHG